MSAVMRIEQSLTEALDAVQGLGCPPRLAAAVRHAVFPGGGRIRPRLCLAVAMACGDDRPAISNAAASAIELLHCASLVHDDLPCFDDAETRRGQPSVHRAFGEPLAILAGDALIVLAFQTLARGAAELPTRLVALLPTISASVGMPTGIVAGQAWECEDSIDLAEYHREKTGSLFAAATVAGATAAGACPDAWRQLGEKLGEAYQVADDIRDMASTAEELGKPIGRDSALGRPSAAIQLGLRGAVKRLQDLVAEAKASIPECPGADDLRALIDMESHRLLPKELVRRAA